MKNATQPTAIEIETSNLPTNGGQQDGTVTIETSNLPADGGQKKGAVAIEQAMVIGGNAKLKLPQISFSQVPP